MRSIQLGLLAVSRVAEYAVVEPARGVPGIEVVGVASRSQTRAADAAQNWGVNIAFDSYSAMLHSDEIDAVYISTPAALHREWTIAAIESGKHVLCEKPLAANAEDARMMVEAAAGTDIVVMEAFHWMYHPIARQMRNIVDSGVLGTIERVDARFEVPASNVQRSDIRWDLRLGGGSLMDMGCYPVSWVRYLIDGEPSTESAVAVCPEPGIDGSLLAELSWNSGVSGSIFSSMITQGPFVASLIVLGTAGRLIVDNPLAPQNGASLVVETESAVMEYPVSGDSTYRLQLAAFRDAVVDGAPFPTTQLDGVANMELIDACYLAAGLQPRPAFP